MIRPAVRLLVTLLVLPGAELAGAQSQPALRTYAILGIDQVRLAPNVRVQTGAVGATAGTVRLAGASRVQGAVVAQSVRVSRSVHVGRLFCGTVSGGVFGSGVVGGPTVGGSTGPGGCLQLTMPVVDPTLLASVPVAPGAEELTIAPRKATPPVAPGAYGAVVVRHGALLELAGGGAYQVRSIRLASAARLVCLDECRIGVGETVTLAAGAQLGAAKGMVDPSEVRLDVAGGPAAPAFRTGPNAVVAGTVFAPTGGIVLGPRGQYRGAFIGRSVLVRPGSRVIADSALPAPPR
jgi:hypothetical protein